MNMTQITLLILLFAQLLPIDVRANGSQLVDLKLNDFVGLYENSERPGFCYDVRVSQGRLEFWSVLSPAVQGQQQLTAPNEPFWAFDSEQRRTSSDNNGKDDWHSKYTSMLRGNELFVIELTRRKGPASQSKMTVNGAEVMDPANDRPAYDHVWAKYFRITLSENRQLMTIRDFFIHLDDEKFPDDGDAGLYYGPDHYTRVAKCE